MDRRLGACRHGPAGHRPAAGRCTGVMLARVREITGGRVAPPFLVGAPAPLRVDGVGTVTDRSAAAVLTRRRALTAFAAFAGGSGLLGACTPAAPQRGAATSPATAAEPATRGRPQAGPAPL